MDAKPVQTKLQLSDFQLLRKIGQGGFGAVYVCRKLDTREVLALKIVNKSLIWKKNKVTQMKNERDVLASHLTTWMVQLAYSFQDPHYCYLAMEYCPGGDLRHLLSALGYLEEHEARIYMAEMILAVFALHSLGYIHRDLKPDNFLVDSKGHLKLTDFGLSKDGLHSSVATRRFTNSLASTSSLPDFHPASNDPAATPQHGHTRSRTNGGAPVATPLFEGRKEDVPADASTLAFSVVGSPHYMSPEVLSGEHGYGAEVDWWSLGCIFFELVTGSPPFVGESPQAVFDAILDWKHSLAQVVEENSTSISPECMDFILRFLCEPKGRYGVKTGLQRIFSHPFFKDFDVEGIFEMEPMFVPQLSDECDTTYFEAMDDKAQPEDDEDVVLHGGGHGVYMEEDVYYEEEMHRRRAGGGGGGGTMNDHGSPTEGNRRMTSTASIQCPQTAPRRLVRHHRVGTASSSDEDSSFPGARGLGGSGSSAFDASSASSPSKIVVGSYGRFGMARSRLGHYHPQTHHQQQQQQQQQQHQQQQHRQHQHQHHKHTNNYNNNEDEDDSNNIINGAANSTTNNNGATTTSATSTAAVRRTPLRRFHAPNREIAGFTFQRKKSIRNTNLANSIIKLDFDSDIPLQYVASSSQSSPVPEDIIFTPSSSSSTLSPCNLANSEFSTLEITPKALVFGDDLTTNNESNKEPQPASFTQMP